MTKKLISLLLCLAMVASLFVATVSAADGETNVSFTVSKDTVEIGDTVEVVVSYSDMTVSSFACGIFFNKDKFECTSIVGARGNNRFYLTSNDPDPFFATVMATAFPTVEESNDTGTVGMSVAGIEIIKESEALINSDVNKDSTISADDLTKLARHVAGIEIIPQ